MKGIRRIWDEGKICEHDDVLEGKMALEKWLEVDNMREIFDKEQKSW